MKVRSPLGSWALLSCWRLPAQRKVFLLLRESALLLCTRIPLKIVYAWPASIAPLQCKGFNLTSASVMGNWTASFADRLLLIYRWTPFPAVSGRDPPKRGPPQHQGSPLPFSRGWTPFPAVSGRDPPKRGAATWPQCSFHFGFNLLFFGAGKVHCFFARGSRCATTMQGLELDLRFCEGKLDCFFCWSASPYLPLDPFSSRERPRSSKKGRRNLTSNVLPFGSSQCLCHTQRLYHRQLSRFLPSVLVGLSGLLSFGRSLSRNTVRNKVCRAHLSHQVGLAQLVEQMTLNLKVEASPGLGHVPFFPAGLCLHGSSCSSSWGKVHCFFARGSRWR